MSKDNLHLLYRQLKDIQSQADKILDGDDSADALESFAKYSAELKEYTLKKIDSKTSGNS
jgi:hypothetical protein